jgi:hypothetical protein
MAQRSVYLPTRRRARPSDREVDMFLTHPRRTSKLSNRIWPV